MRQGVKLEIVGNEPQWALWGALYRDRELPNEDGRRRMPYRVSRSEMTCIMLALLMGN